MFRTFTKIVAGFLVVVTLILAAPGLTVAGQSPRFQFVDRVSAFDTDQWTRFVRAGYHRLEIEGDGDTDLDCFVIDNSGRTLGSDTDRTDYCIVTWNQETDQRVSVRIRNLGRVYNEYEFRLW
jgi:hypothetical protein